MMLMTADRPVLRVNTGMKAMLITGLCFNAFPNHILHLLSPQTVPGFAVFLWDTQPNPSS